MATRQNGELHHEYEDELLSELQAEGGPSYEGQYEFESTFEDEATFEDELGAPESSLHEFQEQVLGESPEAQAFAGKLRRVTRGVGRFVRQAAPVLRSLARVAVPMVAGAVGGPLGGVLSQAATQALGEDESNLEDEHAHETLQEDELGSQELLSEHGFAAHEALPELGELQELQEAQQEAMPESQSEVMAEVMAEVAAGALDEAEAEAMAGAAAISAISSADRAALRRLLPHLIRGVAVLTRVLRRRRITRPAVRAIPTIFRQTVRTLRRHASTGRPVSRRLAGRVMANVTRRMLTNPRVCGATIVRNLRVAGSGSSGPIAG